MADFGDIIRRNGLTLRTNIPVRISRMSCVAKDKLPQIIYYFIRAVDRDACIYRIVRFAGVDFERRGCIFHELKALHFTRVHETAAFYTI